ncbi:MAG TPA: TetR family transcriptional regulator [Thermoleophilaceae bacterium]|jgi:AcrR family transcriptional regulator
MVGAQVTRSRTGLSREGVARAALELLDSEGLDALSMRRLADGLGAGTMTLYGYFRNKEELLDAVVDVGFADFARPAPAADPLDGLRDLMLAARDVLRRHPALVEIRGAGPIVRPRGFAITELALELLMRAGVEPGEAARVFRVLFDYVFGYALVNPRAPSPSLRREALDSIAALPAAGFPAVKAVAEDMADAVAGEEQFEYGLGVILAGVRGVSARA